MRPGVPAREWVTGAVLHAERALDAAVDSAAAEARRADDLLAEVKANEEPATEEEVDEFRQFVTGRGYAPEWAEVIERIGRGELTWREVVEASDSRDSSIQAAYDSMRRVPPLWMETSAESAPDLRSAGQSKERVCDDDYFEEFDPFDES